PPSIYCASPRLASAPVLGASRMAYIPGTDRTQAILLPDVLDDYVTAENPVRFLDAFVAQLELAGLGFQRAVPAETGRPGYDPGDLLRLYLYGYLHRIRSSRRLEQETYRNVELLWLLRHLTAGLQDHRGFPPGSPGGAETRGAGVRAPLPAAGTVWRRAAGHR